MKPLKNSILLLICSFFFVPLLYSQTDGRENNGIGVYESNSQIPGYRDTLRVRGQLLPMPDRINYPRLSNLTVDGYDGPEINAFTQDFTGDFQPSNWQFDGDGGDGSVNTSGAPGSITLFGSDNGSNSQNNTTYCITIPGSSSGSVRFTWNYDTNDSDGPQWDPFGFAVNGAVTQLTDNNGPDQQSGQFSVGVNPGDVICFVANSVDQLFGRSETVIQGFSFQPVTEVVFTTSDTWTAPGGVTEITAEAWGGGGGGATNAGNTGLGGGGGGAYASSTISVTPGATYNITIGSGGIPGLDGGATEFEDGSQLSAEGGSSGNDSDGGAGGLASASNGDVTFSGGNGGNGRSFGNQNGRNGGGGGGSAFTTVNGEDGENGTNGSPGAGGDGTGPGGDGGDRNTIDGENGQEPGGGGGGGAQNTTSGSGANGRMIIRYIVPVQPDPTLTTISAAPASLPADGSSASAITVQTFDEDGNEILFGGASITLSTTTGSLSGVTDNGDGTYSAILTAPSIPGTATISGTLNGDPITDTAVVLITDSTPALSYYPGGIDNTDLELWLDAEDTGTLALSVNEVIQWNDKSGNSNHGFQSNSSERPAFLQNIQNSRPVLRFEAGDFLATNYSPSNLDNGVAVTIALNSTGSGERAYFGSFENPRLYIQNRESDLQTGFGNDWIRQGVHPDDEFISSGFHSNGSLSRGFVNGNLLHSYNSTFSGSNSNLLEIGSVSGLAGRNFTGDFGEVIFYSNQINDTQRLLVENYIGAKWGIDLDPSTRRFVAPAEFDHQLAGIGRISSTDLVTATVYTSGGLGIEATTDPSGFLNSDDNFILFAHNNENDLSSDLISSSSNTYEKLSRAWFVEKTVTGNEGGIEFYFDPVQYGLAAPQSGDSFVLIYHPTNPDFPVSTSQIYEGIDTLDGSLVRFTIQSGEIENGYYTIGRFLQVNTFFSRQSGDFDDPASWSFEGHSGAIAGPVPGEESVIIIGGSGSSDHVISLTDNVLLNNAGSLTVTDTGNGAGNFQLGTFVLSGTGTFALQDGATLGIGSPDGITSDGTAGNIQVDNSSFSQQSNYIYNGTGNQQTGSGLPQEVNNLTISNADTVFTLQSIRVNGTLNLDQGFFLIDSGLSIIANTKNVLSGELIFRRVLDGQPGYRLVSSPVASTFGNLFSNILTQGFTGASLAGDLQPNILWYDETFPGTDNQRWRAPVSSTNNIQPGLGYYIYLFGDVTGDNRYNNPLPDTLIVNGLENEGTGDQIDLNVTYTAEADTGWNLVGNPYGSAIDWEHPSWVKTNIDPSIYIWNPDTNQYLTWNGSTGDIPNGVIAPLQGFWVKANSENPELILHQDAKTFGGTFVGKSTQRAEEPKISLQAYHTRSLQSTAHFIFSESGSYNLDPNDAYKLLPPPEVSSYLEVYSRTNKGQRLAINTIPRRFGSVIEIPFEINAYSEGFPVTEDIWLNVSDFRDIPMEWDVSIMNHQTGESIDLRKQNTIKVSMQHLEQEADSSQKHMTGYQVVTLDPGSHIQFTLIIDPGADAGDLPDTFELKQNFPNPFNPSTTFRFNLPVESDVNIDIYDVLGRKVATLVDETLSAGSYERIWDASDLSSGVYIARMVTINGVHIKKLSLIK
jgi:hypothetical protein